MDSGKGISRERFKSLTKINGKEYVLLSEAEQVLAEEIVNYTGVRDSISEARKAMQEASQALSQVGEVTRDLKDSTGNLKEIK